jgi:hypothetical protein
MNYWLIKTLLTRFLFLKNKRLDILILSHQKSFTIGSPVLPKKTVLVFKNPMSLIKIILTFGNVIKLTELFLKKEIDCEGDILELFRLKNHISFRLIK